MQDIYLLINQNRLLVTALIAVLIVLTLIEWLRQQRGTKQLTPQMATHLINHEEAVIVDIRTTEAYLTGHIPGSISIPNEELSTKYKKIEKYKAKPLIVVGATGIDASNAVNFLQKNNFLSIVVLAGGIRRWKESDMPLVKD